MDQTPVKMRKLFEMSSEIGEKDLISTLPDDCMLSVFDYLDRDSFETMERVSQKMNSVAKSCVKPKKSLDEFILFKSKDLFTLYASPNDKNSSCLVYETSVNVVGVKRTIPALEDGFLPESSDSAESCITPANYFSAIESIYAKCAPGKLFIYELYVDDSFLAQLKTAFHDDLPRTFMFMSISTDEETNFAEFILESKINDLHISWREFPSDRIQQQFNEYFFLRFCDLNASKNRRLEIDLPGGQNTWTPTRDVLPLICRYSELTIHTMILPVDLLPALINMYFNSIDPTSEIACWTFTLSAPIDVNALQVFNIEPYSLEEGSAEERRKLDLSSFLIIHKRDCPFHCELQAYVSVDGLTVLTTTFTDQERE